MVFENFKLLFLQTEIANFKHSIRFWKLTSYHKGIKALIGVLTMSFVQNYLMDSYIKTNKMHWLDNLDKSLWHLLDFEVGVSKSSRFAIISCIAFTREVDGQTFILYIFLNCGDKMYQNWDLRLIKVCKTFRNEDGIHYCILKRLPKMTNILAKFTDVTYICSIFRYNYLFILSSTQNTINRLPANQISNIIASAISFNNKIW